MESESGEGEDTEVHACWHSQGVTCEQFKWVGLCICVPSCLEKVGEHAERVFEGGSRGTHNEARGSAPQLGGNGSTLAWVDTKACVDRQPRAKAEQLPPHARQASPCREHSGPVRPKETGQTGLDKVIKVLNHISRLFSWQERG
eukprot:1147259-Pelagomonas_calceolata.AAC.1